MKSNPRIYLISGRTGSGKTTISKALAKEKNAYRISHDEWLRIVYGPESTAGDFQSQCERVNHLIWKQVESLTALGVDIILEGWGSRKRRDEARSRLNELGIDYEFIYVECPREERWSRIQKRNASIGLEGFPLSEADFARMEAIDEEFEADERATVIDNSMHHQSINATQ